MRLVAVSGEAARSPCSRTQPPCPFAAAFRGQLGAGAAPGPRLARSEQLGAGTGAQAWEPLHARPRALTHPGEKPLDRAVDATCSARLPVTHRAPSTHSSSSSRQATLWGPNALTSSRCAASQGLFPANLLPQGTITSQWARNVSSPPRLASLSPKQAQGSSTHATAL